MSCLEWLSTSERGAIVLVAGPPCAGKTTFARAHALPGDEIVDWDEIYAAETGLPLYEHSAELQPRVDREFRRCLEQVEQGWIIRGAPRAQHRATIRRIHGARVVLLATPASICLERLAASDRPAQTKREQARAVEAWWDAAELSPSGHETVIRPMRSGQGGYANPSSKSWADPKQASSREKASRSQG